MVIFYSYVQLPEGNVGKTMNKPFPVMIVMGGLLYIVLPSLLLLRHDLTLWIFHSLC